MYYVGPLSARQRNVIVMAFRWWIDIGPFLMAFGSSIPKKQNKTKPLAEYDPPQTKRSGSAHAHQPWLIVITVDLIMYLRQSSYS